MKISCEIIKDLLPLYHDGVCSSDSKAMIEEHLACCHSCSAELQAMDRNWPLTNTEHNLKEAEAVKKLSRRWRKGMNKALVKGILLTIAVIVLFALLLYSFLDIKVITTP